MGMLNFKCEAPEPEPITFGDLKIGECYIPRTGSGVFIKMTTETAFSFTRCGTRQVATDTQVQRIDATLHWRITPQ